MADHPHPKKINDSVTELNSIVENILTHKRKVDLYRQPTDVNKALDEVLSDIEELMEGHAVGIVREYEEGLPLAALDPFFTTRSGGIGLGLPVVQQLVSLHGGRLQVESRPGQGSEFRILLPICANL